MRTIIAGGGTGGHLFPGIAIAEELTMRDPNNEVLFVGTTTGLEAQVLPKRKIPLHTILVLGMKGKSFVHKLQAFGAIPRAIMESINIIKGFHPDLVIGLGAYVAGPMLVAASLLRRWRVIQEQNVIPGTTNRITARLAHRVFVSFEESRRYFACDKVLVTGNPIRREFVLPFTSQTEKGFGLLVCGGSRGAHRINQAMIEAVELLADLKRHVRIVHQAGFDDAQEVAEAYQRKGFSARVDPFIEDMATPYRQSNLVVCRAGATTIAELTACGRAAVLIPYPFAAHNHQEVNARTLVNKGAAKMILDRDLSGTTLASMIRSLFQQPVTIRKMEHESVRLGRPDAAERIVDECYRLVT
jgi:UDP-N-acetylglucosamine--N-acetylmuramyl-(pentapeptide) pyrophosphoryl-undecaprenol N-acetylglucosamine transferase